VTLPAGQLPIDVLAERRLGNEEHLHCHQNIKAATAEVVSPSCERSSSEMLSKRNVFSSSTVTCPSLSASILIRNRQKSDVEKNIWLHSLKLT